MAEANLELVAVVQRPHARQQLGVTPFFGLEMRGADQHQRGGIGGKLVAAAVRPLQRRKQRVDAREVFIRVARVPDPHREQRQDVHEVVVEQDRQLDSAGRFGASLLGHETQDIDRDDVRIGALRHAVPVVQDMKAFRARPAVVRSNGAIEKDLVAADAKLVGAHRLAEQREAGAERFRGGELVDNLLSRRSLQGAVEDGAGLFERDVQS